MSALCAARASCWRVGSAPEEISTERGSLPCSWSASILTILPSVTVTRTWAAPYWVSTASPVAVFEEPVVEEPLDGVAVAVLAAVALWTAGACAWKASTPAVPASVAGGAVGGRRIRWGPGAERGRLRRGPGPGHPRA